MAQQCTATHSLPASSSVLVNMTETKLPCPLLDRLPVEIRLEILRYLVGKHTHKELDMKSAEYDNNRPCILGSGDYTYQLHPTILGANKQLRHEALNVLLRENAFIHLSSRQCTWEELWYPGFSALAREDRADPSFAAISLDFDGAYRVENLYRGSWFPRRKREHVYFSANDLPIVCAMIMRKAYKLRSPTLKITMGEHVQGNVEIATFVVPKLLATLQKDIRGLRNVRIHGIPDSQLVASTIAAMCRTRRSTAQVMRAISQPMDRATAASKEGNERQAITEYKVALNTVRASCFDDEESLKVVSGGRFHGMLVGVVRNDVEIQLHSLIATSYLRLGKTRMARIYVERIYGPLHSWDDRNNKEKFPLEEGKGSRSAYAELLGVAAQISWSHGKLDEALEELREAERLDPESLKIEKQLEQYEAHAKKHWARKNKRQ